MAWPPLTLLTKIVLGVIFGTFAALALAESATSLPLAAVLAIWFFIRGHNDPGGGFIGGLTLALGMLVPFIGRGIDWVESRVRLQLQRWIGVGLAIATLSGIASFVVGHPFLTSHYFAGELTVLGKSSLASAMFFDLGVFVAVAGATLLALSTIGRMERR